MHPAQSGPHPMQWQEKKTELIKALALLSEYKVQYLYLNKQLCEDVKCLKFTKFDH